MPTVNISAAVDKMMKNMFAETMEECVAKLSQKYGFDEKEALEFLEIDYLLYSADVREQVKAKLIEDGGEGKPKDVVQAIAAKWKALTDEEKGVWNEKAKATKEPVHAN
jgi:DNA-binding FrmR family transcriptional regulator